MKFDYYGLSDKGKVRINNEDSFIIDGNINFIAVADGMGGHKSGEVASNMAVNITLKNLKKYFKKEKELPKINKDLTFETNILLNAVEEANMEIYEKAQEEENKGMGTTLTCVLLNNSLASIVHIGDSRAYIVRNWEIFQITEDDSFIMEQYRSGKITLQEMEKSPFKNVLTKALGTKKYNTYFVREEKINPGDIILLSTDGLTKMLSNKEIVEILKKNKDMKESVKELIKNANTKGGEDNITVVLAKAEKKNIFDMIKEIIK